MERPRKASSTAALPTGTRHALIIAMLQRRQYAVIPGSPRRIVKAA